MIAPFFSLYLATLLLLVGSGLFNSYLGLRLTAEGVSEVWIGALMAVYYLGLVMGARVGHKLIIGVGHIRAYASTAAVVTVAVLAQALVVDLWFWLALRLLAGMAMVTQFMVLESWLNEQTDNASRGRVFAFYMVFSGLGTVLGQLSLRLFGDLGDGPLIFVAMCSALCLIPITLTRRLHPAMQVPAPIEPRFYLKRVPMSLTVLFMAGTITGAFYGLAPVYAANQGMSTEAVGLFLAAGVAAGMVAQWPMGWLADRVGRVRTMWANALLLTLLPVALWGWLDVPNALLPIASALLGILQFTLYPLGAAFANDNVPPERRVGLSAILLMVYGLGACVGPLLVGVLMRHVHSDMFYVFVSACAAVLVFVVRPRRVTGDHLSADAPTQFVPMAESLEGSAVLPELDPRIAPADTTAEDESAADTVAADDDAAITPADAEPGDSLPPTDPDTPAPTRRRRSGPDVEPDDQLAAHMARLRQRPLT